MLNSIYDHIVYPMYFILKRKEDNFECQRKWTNNMNVNQIGTMDNSYRDVSQNLRNLIEHLIKPK